MKLKNIYLSLLTWRVRYIGDRNFVVLLSAVIGLVAGVAAVTLKNTVHLIQDLLAGTSQWQYGEVLYLAFPLVGIMLTSLVAHYILRERLGHGITDILFSINKRSSKIKPSKMWNRMITSAITVGFGGSVGLEAPIAVTGSAIGSNMGQLFHLGYKERSLLIGCGAAGAISAIFNSPIAGVIFAIEVLLSEVTITVFIPVLIASVGGSLISQLLGSKELLFAFPVDESFPLSSVPFFALLGVLAGLVSVFFSRTMRTVEGQLGRLGRGWLKALVGGVLLAAIVLVFPPIYGEGYSAITALLNGQETVLLERGLLGITGWNANLFLLFLAGVVLLKPVASALTIGAGGSGGIFAPSLFMGGMLGYTTSRLLNDTLGLDLNPANFTLVGMCGVMSGVLHAPLTAIFLIAEVTSGYTLFVPLMLVSALAYYVANYFEKSSLYTKKLVERGDFIPFDKDLQVLNRLELKRLIETDLYTISPSSTLGDLVQLVRISRRNIFPVVNREGELKGIVTLDDVRNVMFDPEAQSRLHVRDLMQPAPETIRPGEPMQAVMNKFEKTGAWNLPVIDEGKYVGFLSKSRIFNAYRHYLTH